VKKILMAVLIAGLLWTGILPALASNAQPVMSADEALQKLKEGNGRYVAGKPKHLNQTRKRRAETVAKGQHPFATVLACSDSREAVEILFDQGIGDVFVVRVAGNVADVDEIGSMEYGVDHLVTPLLVVLGHTHCGAVTAVAQGAELHGSIPALVDNIIPAVKKVKDANPGISGKELIDKSIPANVWQSIEDLLTKSPAARERVKKGDLKIIGAVYDLESGKIDWMGSHPSQDKLLAAAESPVPTPVSAVAPAPQAAPEPAPGPGPATIPAPAKEAQPKTKAPDEPGK
jgi:carbonic anhydrase